MTTDQHLPPELEQTLAAAAKRLGASDPQGCVEILRPVVDMEPRRLVMHQLLAQAQFELGRHAEVLASARYCMQNWSLHPSVDPWITFRVLLYARTSAMNVLDWSEQQAYLWSCTDGNSRAVHELAGMLLAGEYPLAQDRFDRLLQLLVTEESARANWFRALAALVDGLKGIALASPVKDARPLRKIIVSGKGWSGSGAVFDFLREFPGVVPVWGESQYIDGARGIRTLVKAVHDADKFRLAAVEFFFCCLFGHYRLEEWDMMKSFIEARERLQSPSLVDYSEHVLAVSECLAEVLSALPSARDAALARLCEAVLDRIAVTKPVPDGGYALLDNVVHIDDVEMMRYIGHTDIYCTFRDPRSNYVALVRECDGFSKPAAEFAAEQKVSFPRLRRLADRVRAELDPATGSKVHVVQFEEFVLSAAFRRQLVSELGLDHSGARRYEAFRPWESARNVFLHEEFERQEDIELLESELAEHCVSVSIHPVRPR